MCIEGDLELVEELGHRFVVAQNALNCGSSEGGWVVTRYSRIFQSHMPMVIRRTI